MDLTTGGCFYVSNTAEAKILPPENLYIALGVRGRHRHLEGEQAMSTQHLYRIQTFVTACTESSQSLWLVPNLVNLYLYLI